ncbi:MAG: phage/plasmid primase, P4 family, partial [Acetobacteraceae bacterium]
MWERAGTPNTNTVIPSDLTEDAIARAFAEQHAEHLRFDHDAGAWFRWDGNIWRREETMLAFEWCREQCRAAAAGLDNAKLRAVLGRASTASAVERFARADRAFAVTAATWDRDPFLLGTPAGTVDLRTGRLRSPMQTDFVSKSTAVAPADRADCPRWRQFLEDATRGDAGFVGFLRQWCGYCLAGDIREHALLFIFGPGGNGKTVLLNTVSTILGDYAATAAMDTFTASQGDRHPTDLAMLRGARLVSVSETEEGRSWAETRIKALTGGDAISARFMRQDFFTFKPTFKITVIGNHKPILRNVDEAARRRFNLAPFVFKPTAPDKVLEEKLRAEHPAI